MHYLRTGQSLCVSQNGKKSPLGQIAGNFSLNYHVNCEYCRCTFRTICNSRFHFQDHIAEVFEKWANIEDEIWAKVIILERNRRVAKAYARAPVLTLNGSEDGFDGFKIGVNGFDNPMRDHKVKEFKAQIGAGCKLKMGDNGDILVKRIGKGNIYIKNILEETAVSNEILKLPNGLLELDRALKLFDMKKFKQNMNREMKRQYPDRNKIETQVGGGWCCPDNNNSPDLLFFSVSQLWPL